MKLVELLARELKEWPIGTVSMTQDDDGAVNQYDHDSPVTLSTKCTWRCIGFTEYLAHLKEISSDQQTVIVTEKMWQAERDRQKGGEWRRHRGGKQPVANEVLVEFKFHSGVTGACYASDLLWDHQKQDDDVMQYRVISQPQAEEVEVNVFVGKDVKIEYAYAQEGVEPEHLEWKTMGTAKIDSICDLGSTEAKTEQIDGPIKWRDTVNELDAYIEEFTREREALIERLASEGFALIPPVVSVVSEFSGVDMQDWRNWKVGDVFITNGECRYYTKGKEYSVHGLENDSAPIKAMDDDGDVYSLFMEEVKFIRRP